MSETCLPPLEAESHRFEQKEESPLIQSTLRWIRSKYDEIFANKKKEELPADDFSEMTPRNIAKLQQLCVGFAGEWLSGEDLCAIHEELRKKTGREEEIAQFLKADKRVVADINKLFQDIESLVGRYQEKELDALYTSERSRIIIAYLNRFFAEDNNRRYKTGVVSDLPKKIENRSRITGSEIPENLPASTELKGWSAETPDNVISLTDKIHPKPLKPKGTRAA